MCAKSSVQTDNRIQPQTLVGRQRHRQKGYKKNYSGRGEMRDAKHGMMPSLEKNHFPRMRASDDVKQQKWSLAENKFLCTLLLQIGHTELPIDHRHRERSLAKQTLPANRRHRSIYYNPLLLSKCPFVCLPALRRGRQPQWPQ